MCRRPRPASKRARASVRLTSEGRKRRFVEAVREAGASGSEADSEAALKPIAKKKPSEAEG
ncbi:hypothetical protein D8770_10085 [Methylobacterium sp. DB1607]|nr:hypothetical protein [Methylobacterium sp. DB1607]